MRGEEIVLGDFGHVADFGLSRWHHQSGEEGRLKTTAVGIIIGNGSKIF
jgi:hypothetical protein